jgi:hypothetical protein
LQQAEIMKDKELIGTEYILTASNHIYLGFGIIASVLGLLGYFFDTDSIKNFFYGATILLSSASGIDMLFYQKKQSSFLQNSIEILRGSFKRQEIIALEDVKKVEIFGDNSHHLGDLKDFVFENHTIIIKKIKLILKNTKTIEFNSYDYVAEDFSEFLLFFQQKYKEVVSTQAEKLQTVAQKCETLLKQDKQLSLELQETMRLAYQSVYETHCMHVQAEEKEFVKEQIRNLQAIYSYTLDNKTYYYFLENSYLETTEETDILMAKNLIETSQKNIILVENRMQAYRQVQQKMKKILEKQAQKNQLKNVVDKLYSLQEKNILSHQLQDDIQVDAEVYEQYAILLHQIEQIETIDQTEFLKQYIVQIEKL